MISRLIAWINDSENSFNERMLVLMTAIADVALMVVVVGDILTGENPVEILILASTVVLGPCICYITVKKKNARLGAILLGIGTSLISIPTAFFFGGGLSGGAIIWIPFTYLYIGLILKGRARSILLFVFTGTTIMDFVLSYNAPDLIEQHKKLMSHIDIGISVVVVSIIIYVMVRFQNRMFLRENELAEEQAKKIEELNRSQNRFFSSMSHEIRTPINTIIGLNEMILRENASDEINENAANIQVASKMLLQTINDILDMSKFESGQMDIVPVSYHTGDMLSDIVGMLWLKAKDKNLEFHIKVSEDIPGELIGDEVRIKQILINVLTNAIKYTNEGSVTLSIQCERKGAKEVNVIYTVTDTGMGIKKESIPYLFTAFKRIDEEKNRYIEGTGLGLSIVKKFLDLMGGNISVNSVYTKGSTFTIQIPQKIASDEAIGKIDLERRHNVNRMSDYHQSFEAPGAKVLVVDDTVANLLVVEKLLRATKVQLTTSDNGEDALKKTLADKYDVIFMDHMMPQMDGIECFHKIREQTGGLCRESKIIALTANAGGDSAALYAREGFDGYLVKPISGNSLENELRRHLPKELVVFTGDEEDIVDVSLHWDSTTTSKTMVAVTTDSLADIPPQLVEKYHIHAIPHIIIAGEGIFRDGTEIEQNGLLSYMQRPDADVSQMMPSVEDFETFFAKELEHANNIVHISVPGSVENSALPNALEASKVFDNIFVVESAHLSTAEGIIAVEAAKMAMEGASAEEIVDKIDMFNKMTDTDFIVNDMTALANAGQMSTWLANLADSFMLRPVIGTKKGKLGLRRIYMGSVDRIWSLYIRYRLSSPDIDRSMLIITYVGISETDLTHIKEEVEKKMSFDKIYFQKASSAIAANCGPSTFGLFFKKQKRE